MIAVNLMPRDRLCRARRGDRVRTWTLVLVVYSVLVGGVMLIASRVMSDDDRVLLTRIERLSDESALLEQAVSRLKVELSATSSALSAARAIGEHPDWSVLLAKVGSIRGDSVVLDEVEIAARAIPGGSGAAAARPSAYTLRLAGVADEHRAVTQLALRLESLSIFDKVAIIDTRMQETDKGGMVGFKIECDMSDSGRGGGR